MIQSFGELVLTKPEVKQGFCAGIPEQHWGLCSGQEGLEVTKHKGGHGEGGIAPALVG